MARIRNAFLGAKVVTFEMQEILRSKRALRVRLASLPIGEKLRMLDILRDRCLELAAVRAKLRAAAAARPNGGSPLA